MILGAASADLCRPANHEYELSLGTASYADCFKGNLGKRLLTGCLLQALQQCMSLLITCHKQNLAKSFDSSNRRQFHLLLWDLLLRQQRHPESLHRQHHHLNREHPLHDPRPLCRRQIRSPLRASGWCHWHGGDSGQSQARIVLVTRNVSSPSTVHRRNHRHRRWNRQPSRTKSAHCRRLRLHCKSRLTLHRSPICRSLTAVPHAVLLRLLMGSLRLGCNRRDLPAQSPRKVALHDHRFKLALELGYRIHDALPSKPGPRKRRSGRQSILPLGRLLLHLHRIRLGNDIRDEGVHAGAGR